MTFLEQLRTLDINDIGRWPLLFRALLIGLLFVLVVFIGIWFQIIKDKNPALEHARQQELTLRSTFEGKQRQARVLPGVLIPAEPFEVGDVRLVEVRDMGHGHPASVEIGRARPTQP